MQKNVDDYVRNAKRKVKNFRNKNMFLFSNIAIGVSILFIILIIVYIVKYIEFNKKVKNYDPNSDIVDTMPQD